MHKFNAAFSLSEKPSKLFLRSVIFSSVNPINCNNIACACVQYLHEFAFETTTAIDSFKSSWKLRIHEVRLFLHHPKTIWQLEDL